MPHIPKPADGVLTCCNTNKSVSKIDRVLLWDDTD